MLFWCIVYSVPSAWTRQASSRRPEDLFFQTSGGFSCGYCIFMCCKYSLAFFLIWQPAPSRRSYRLAPLSQLLLSLSCLTLSLLFPHPNLGGGRQQIVDLFLLIEFFKENQSSYIRAGQNSGEFKSNIPLAITNLGAVFVFLSLFLSLLSQLSFYTISHTFEAAVLGRWGCTKPGSSSAAGDGSRPFKAAGDKFRESSTSQTVPIK